MPEICSIIYLGLEVIASIYKWGEQIFNVAFLFFIVSTHPFSGYLFERCSTQTKRRNP